MNRTTVIRTAAFVGFMGVALGAFGAHQLKPLLLGRDTMSFWETAVLYQFVHLSAFILLALTEKKSKLAYACFVGGIIMFSGSLYVLALVPAQGFLYGLVFVTPLGGLLLIVGWVALFLSADKTPAEG